MVHLTAPLTSLSGRKLSFTKDNLPFRLGKPAGANLSLLTRTDRKTFARVRQAGTGRKQSNKNFATQITCQYRIFNSLGQALTQPERNQTGG